jgi:hypothetical protein
MSPSGKEGSGVYRKENPQPQMITFTVESGGVY